MDPQEFVTQQVLGKLAGGESDDQLLELVNAVPLPVGESLTAGQVDAVVEAIRDEAAPKVIVDWGPELPQIGHAARPEFLFIFPSGYGRRPVIDVDVDDQLEPGRKRPPHQIKPGLWSFHVPFSLTTDGKDCRPGFYLLNLSLSFAEMADAGRPRFFRATIRLHVRPPGDGNPRELVIDGDGQSVVNLQGHDLRNFGRVVLRGGDKAIINLAKGLADDEPEEADESSTESITHIYPLKVDQERQEQVPRITDSTRRGSRLEMAMLRFEDNRRVLLIPKSKRSWVWTFGRNRSNDVNLRFLPRNDQNDRATAGLSRLHMELELTTDGLTVRDLQSRGLAIENKMVDGETVLTAEDDAHAPWFLELGPPLGTPLELSLKLYAADEDPFGQSDDELRDRLYCEVLGQPFSSLRLARTSGIDAVCLRRLKNLEGLEDYVLLGRQALVGPSEDTHPVTLPDERSVAARFLYARRTFWLENLSNDPDLVRVDGNPLAPRELIPLTRDVALTFGSTECTFDKVAQLYVDEEPTES